MKKLTILTILLLITSCASTPPDAFVATADLQQKRQIETRRYDGINEIELISASANVLQDMGFNLENSETKLGVITASKERDATHAGEIATAVVVAVFTGVLIPTSRDQTIRVSLVARPVIDSKGNSMIDNHFVRVTFQRLVRRSDNSVKVETLSDPQLYQGFFEQLSKSVFLEAQKI
ncbi:hypothetical protein SAMN05216302_10544 [Nitrosomonas aestuarii]|uniref:Lipoprotein n=1 Tax=Nitrosomonas aestuarii TaxID=52441 RepID=A0A1I4GFU9_9PROT|nr:hypothetical protein [Nitrosomonas aestuarii]SFL28875.1 hypothetical protein SAMN05216302_10544 [Nitrosomonas aestuarii]